eukprot:3408305-Pleurochrysis_carterae.AAC.1
MEEATHSEMEEARHSQNGNNRPLRNGRWTECLVLSARLVLFQCARRASFSPIFDAGPQVWQEREHRQV